MTWNRKKMNVHVARCLMAVFMAFSCLSAALALDGPDKLMPGQFAVYTADTDGDWAVLPDMAGCYAKDSSGKAMFMAIPESGTYSIVHFAVLDGKPKIEVKTVMVGGESVPDGKTDVKPEPKPSPEIALTNAEKAAMKAAAETVLASMSAGTTKTPQGARYLLKQTLLQKIGTCDVYGCRLPENVNKTLAVWEHQMDITTMDGLRTGLSKIVEEWK